MHSIRRSRLIGILVLAGALPAAGQAAAVRRSQPAGQERTDRLIVKFRDRRAARAAALGAADLSSLSGRAGVRLAHLSRMSGEAQVLRLPGKMPLAQVEELLERVRQDPAVEYAEPDRLLQPMLAPNDPKYPEQWHYFAPASTAGGANLPAAWDVTTGDPAVVTAVIDTGWLEHQDLAGRSVPGYCFITDADVANSASCTPKEAVSDPSDPGDWVSPEESEDCPDGPLCGCSEANSSWHGTHVAGIIGAASNNGIGVAGVNWNSKILPIRVLGKCGGYTSDIINGMQWAAGIPVTGYPANPNPAKVLNLSLGGSGACTAAWQNAISSVTDHGAVVVVSAGNESSNLTFSPVTPGSCSGVISVAAVGRDGERAWFTNYGKAVAIAAPGGDDSTFSDSALQVMSTLNSGTKDPKNVGVPDVGSGGDIYGGYQGTSQAAPHVAGVAALMFSINPDLKPAQVKQILQSTARAFPGGSGCNTSICGSGLLDAAAAVKAALPAAPSGLTATVAGVSSITWSWGDSGAASYNFHYSTGGPASNLAAASLTQVGLATNTAYGAAVSAITGAEGPRSSTVTAHTLAAPPTSFALVQVNQSSITVYWAANTNWGTTTYRVDYWLATGSTFSITTQASHITDSTATVTNLFGGAHYWLTVSALNGDGVAAAGGAVLDAVTAPDGSSTIGPSGGVVMAGPATLRIPAGAYSQDVQVSLLPSGSLSCGASSVETLDPTGVGLEVALDPAIEPVRSILLTMSYENASIADLDPARLAIARCDTVTNTWVPLPSTVDKGNKTVTAASGHLSLFQIMLAAPAASGAVSQFKVGPNPLRPSHGQSQMNFIGPAGAEVRIYTLTGELVKDLALQSNGTGWWDATNRGGRPVASGVYFVYVKSGSRSHTFKVIVER